MTDEELEKMFGVLAFRCLQEPPGRGDYRKFQDRLKAGVEGVIDIVEKFENNEIKMLTKTYLLLKKFLGDS